MRNIRFYFRTGRDHRPETRSTPHPKESTVNSNAPFFNITTKKGVKGGITWLNPYVNMSLLGRYKNHQFVYTNEMTQTIERIGGYTTFDAKIWKEVLKGLTLSVSAENLLDKNYMESADDKAPGLFVTGQATYRF